MALHEVSGRSLGDDPHTIETNRFEVDERVIDRPCAIHRNSRSELQVLQ
jgi:hypothetical protein